MLKVNTKKHLGELIKDRDSWKTNCIKLWKGVAPVLDLISPELPEDQPRAPRLTLVEKAQRAWDWLQQFVKDAGEFAGAHVLSMVRAHYPLVDLSRLERGYPKEVGPQEVDDLRAGLLDLLSTVTCRRPAGIRQVGQGVVGSIPCRRWAVDACSLDQPGAGGPDPFV